MLERSNTVGLEPPQGNRHPHSTNQVCFSKPTGLSCYRITKEEVEDFLSPWFTLFDYRSVLFGNIIHRHKSSSFLQSSSSTLLQPKPSSLHGSTMASSSYSHSSGYYPLWGCLLLETQDDPVF
ncbi:hypothetical protein F2P79_024678 [Pimephales promelas]|nr:hypothetical protein F2P79_024678 [Pimephales promelas]